MTIYSVIWLKNIMITKSTKIPGQIGMVVKLTGLISGSQLISLNEEVYTYTGR